MADRERVGRDASPTAVIIDSQRPKTTKAGGPRAYDAGKKINGRKRHALADTDGRGLVSNRIRASRKAGTKFWAQPVPSVTRPLLGVQDAASYAAT